MNMQGINPKRSQALLDFIIIFGILLVFLTGLTRIWIWFNANYAKRNVDYQNTRLAAGTANDVHLDTLPYQDATLEINDDWVFKGKPSGTVGMPPAAITVLDIGDGTGGDNSSEIICNSARSAAAALRKQAKNMDDQADQLQKIVDVADKWWKPLWFWFKVLGIDVNDYKKAIKALRKGADDARSSADRIETTACDENARRKAMLEIEISEKRERIAEQELEIQRLRNEGAPEDEIIDAEEILEELNLELEELLAELAALEGTAAG